MCVTVKEGLVQVALEASLFLSWTFSLSSLVVRWTVEAVRERQE